MISVEKTNNLISLFRTHIEAAKASGQSTSTNCEQLKEFFKGLSREEVEDLIVLMLIGRGDFILEEMEDCRRHASEYYFDDCPDYLLDKKALDKFLLNGMQKLGLSENLIG